MTAWVPLRLVPILKPRIWGGTALRDDWGKTLPTADLYGESWELVWRPEDVSHVAGGPFDGRSLAQLAEDDREGLVGRRLAAAAAFPLLAKLLDCRRRLSVQVHPTPAYAARHPEAEVKMEAWYVLAAAVGASLVFGLRPGTTREDFAAAVRDGRVADTLATRAVHAGDVLLVTPGTVHALLEGLLVYEIQQSSDTTFRVFDWDRLDADGRPRQLHVDQALDCIAFDAPVPPPITPLLLDEARSLLVATPAFCLERIVVRGEWTCALDGSRCELLTATAGTGTIDGAEDPVRPGQSWFIPAGLARYRVRGPVTLLRAYVPDWATEVWAAARAAGYPDVAIRGVCGGFGADGTLA